MTDGIHDLEETICRMTHLLRNHGQSAQDCEANPSWWVVACGDCFDQDSFEQRDRARDGLRQKLREEGIVLAEHIWVWDEHNQAQVVVGTFEELESASEFVDYLRKRNIEVRIIKEMNDASV